MKALVLTLAFFPVFAHAASPAPSDVSCRFDSGRVSVSYTRPHQHGGGGASMWSVISLEPREYAILRFESFAELPQSDQSWGLSLGDFVVQVNRQNIVRHQYGYTEKEAVLMNMVTGEKLQGTCGRGYASRLGESVP